VDNPPGWHGVFWRAGDAMRCDAVRSRRGCQNNHRRRHLRKRVLQISSLQELVCLVQPLAGPNARLVPVLLSSLSSPLLRSAPPPLLPALPSHAHALALALAHPHGWHAVVLGRSPMPDQEAKLLGVSHAGPPPPTLRSFNRCQSCASAREASIRTEFHTRTIASPLQFRMSWRS
jgi:hypothetical protein